MDNDITIIKKCYKVLKKWMENFDEDDIKKQQEILEKIRNKLNNLLENIDLNREKEELAAWINEKYEDCSHLRGKIEWEGLDYFYYHYTTVPVSIDKLQEFYGSDACYCGNNCMDE